jgi:hypothetical protein
MRNVTIFTNKKHSIFLLIYEMAFVNFLTRFVSEDLHEEANEAMTELFAAERELELERERERETAALNIQRYWRGNLGRDQARQLRVPGGVPGVLDIPNPYPVGLPSGYNNPEVRQEVRHRNQLALLADITYRYKWERDNNNKPLLHSDLREWLRPKYGVAPYYLSGPTLTLAKKKTSWWANARMAVCNVGYCIKSRSSKNGRKHSSSVTRRRQKYNIGGNVLWAQVSTSDVRAIGGNGKNSAWIWIKNNQEYQQILKMNENERINFI